MEIQTPLVSILITAYNRQDFLSECIDSALNVTYPNVEIIIVDDASTDNTFSIAEEYSFLNDRIKVFKNVKNQGQFKNRNIAAEYSSGEYLKYLDSDDTISPNCIQEMLFLMEKYPSAGLCLSSPTNYEGLKIFTPTESFLSHFIKGSGIFNRAPLSSLIKKSAFINVGGFSNFNGEGDFDFWLKLCSNYDLVLCDIVAGVYRVHENQIDYIRRSNEIVSVRYRLVSMKYICRFRRLGFIIKIKLISSNLIMICISIIKGLFFNSKPTINFLLGKVNFK